MATFFDTHAHLADPVFELELPELIERARVAGIVRIVTIGTDLENSRRCIEIAEQFPNVYAAVGWHPSHVMEAPNDIRPALRGLAAHPKVVALGETGLDHYWLPSKKPGHAAEEDIVYKQRQAELFRQHLEVGAELGLGCVVHTRDSFAATVQELIPFASRVRTVFHCFSYDSDSMRQVIALGSFVSFTGILTFKNAGVMRQTLSEVPSDRFMFETDSPYLAPVPYRGKRCEPAYVKEIAEAAAQARNVSIQELSACTCAAAEDFFRFKR
jgi:TatD DNase family protein